MRVVKCPDLIKADEIEDVEGSPLAFLEVEIRDGFGSLLPLVIVLRAFRQFICRNKNGRTRTEGGAGRTIFLVVGKARKAVIEGVTEGLEPPSLFEGEGLPKFMVIISFLQDMSGAHKSAQFVDIVWHNE